MFREILLPSLGQKGEGKKYLSKVASLNILVHDVIVKTMKQKNMLQQIAKVDVALLVFRKKSSKRYLILNTIAFEADNLFEKNL